MATTVSISASRRTATGHKVGALRRSGKLPGVIYGPGVEPLAIELEAREAGRILTRLGGARLIDLSLDDTVAKVLVRDVQRDFIRGDLLHVDFYRVAMDRPIRLTIGVTLVGEAPAAKEGVLMHGITEIDIECLPGDIPNTVEADLSVLTEIGDSLHVRDLYLPKTIKVLSDGDELLARVTYQAKEEEVPVEVAPVTAEVELVERKRKEDEEEGEAESEE